MFGYGPEFECVCCGGALPCIHSTKHQVCCNAHRPLPARERWQTTVQAVAFYSARTQPPKFSPQVSANPEVQLTRSCQTMPGQKLTARGPSGPAQKRSCRATYCRHAEWRPKHQPLELPDARTCSLKPYATATRSLFSTQLCGFPPFSAI